MTTNTRGALGLNVKPAIRPENGEKQVSIMTGTPSLNLSIIIASWDVRIAIRVLSPRKNSVPVVTTVIIRMMFTKANKVRNVTVAITNSNGD